MHIKKWTAALSAAAMLTALPAPLTVSHAAASTITVGSGRDYATIREAVAAAKEINPQSESERITINVDPGTYEEQVRIDNMKYLTLQQTPGTEGKVNLNWYYCTSFYTSNADLNGLYDPKLDWSKDETWNGYNEGDEEFTKYTIGQSLSGVSTISYYDTDGVAHKDVPVNSMLDKLGGLAWSYDKMAPLIVTRSSSDITIKDFNIVNSTVVMKTQGQEDGHLTPNPDSNLPDHNALAVCSEDTAPVKPTADIFNGDGSVSIDKYKSYVASQPAGFKFTEGESIWLAQSSIFNERGHAIAILGDRIICEDLRVRGNQDSVWVSDGRAYFKNCDLIGGTDYIYGSGATVFDGCKLGLAGFTDKPYGSPITTPNTDASRKYGYLFYNCTIYNMLNNNGTNNFGGPWGADGQATFYNTVLDDSATVGKSASKIEDKGWGRFGAENGVSRLYEYGTTNNSGAAVDLSKRVVNKSVREGGTGMGTVLDKWQILEFNPRNYFSAKNDSSWTDGWDPMGFNQTVANVDAALNNTTITVPAGEATEIALPAAPAGIEYHWVSASANAAVSEDGTKITVVRPAAGEDAISSSVTLYARDTETGLGDKKEIPVTINATTDTANVFNIPVKITQSLAAANKYTVTVSKNGALIKQQEINFAAGDTEVSATIANIPASADGIDYDVAIVSESNDYTITAPESGKTTVKGIIGNDAALDIKSDRIIDKTVTLDISTAAADGNKTYDLIALAKAKGASDEIATSDIISVAFDFFPNSAPTSGGIIDISSGTPSNANSAVADRFTAVKINNSWTQLDTVDNTQGFSGSSNSEHQCLNVTGKFDSYTATHTVTATINYKNSTVTVDGSASGTGKTATPWTFGSFPENAAKGTLNMGVFPGSASDSYTISNIKVTYKKVATEEDLTEPEPTPTPTPTPTPEPVTDSADVLEYPFDNTYVTGGNQCDNTSTLMFSGGADEDAKALFADPADSTRIRADLVAHYKNYISGTASNGTHPQIKVTAPAGKYRLYLLGYNNESQFTATMNGITYTANNDWKNFAYKEDQPHQILKLYTIDFTLDEAVYDEVMTFDTTAQWLPDTYAVIIKPMPTDRAFTFEKTIEKDFGGKITLNVSASKDGKTESTSKDITEKFERWSGTLCIGLIIKDVPADVTINSANITVE